MSQISKSVLEKIDKQEIKPRPRWQFILWHILLWLVVAITVLLGGLATSIMLLKLFTMEWTLVPRLGGRFFILLPYVWFALVGLTIFISSIAFEKTKKGYRHKPWIIAGISVLISLVIGAVFFATKTGEVVEQAMLVHIGPYGRLQEFREKVFQIPDEGILPGRIKEVTSATLIVVDDLTGKEWNVSIPDMGPLMGNNLEAGMDILAIGEQTGDSDFKAESIKVRRDAMFRTGMPMPPPHEF